MNPVSYKWINDKQEGKKTHQGLIAQDVEAVMDTRGMSKDEHAVVHYDEGEDKYRMNYNELIVPLIKVVQELKADNDAIKARLDALEIN